MRLAKQHGQVTTHPPLNYKPIQLYNFAEEVRLFAYLVEQGDELLPVWCFNSTNIARSCCRNQGRCTPSDGNFQCRQGLTMGCLINVKGRYIELIRSSWLIYNTCFPELAVNAIPGQIVADQCARLGKVR